MHVKKLQRPSYPQALWIMSLFSHLFWGNINALKQRFKLCVSTAKRCLWNHGSKTEPSTHTMYTYWCWSLLVLQKIVSFRTWLTIYLKHFAPCDWWELPSLQWVAQKCWERIGIENLTGQMAYYLQWPQKQTAIWVILH